MDSSWRGRLLRRTQRSRAVRCVAVCHEVVSEIGGWWEPYSLCFKVSFFSRLENVRGWLKVTPKLARPNWRLDSSACKKGKVRGTRKTGMELVAGLQCHTDRSEARDRRDFQDQSAISSGTQKTNLDSFGGWDPRLSTEGEWTSGRTL